MSPTCPASGSSGSASWANPWRGTCSRPGYQLTVHSRSSGPVEEVVAAGAARGRRPGHGRGGERRHDHDAARHADVEQVLAGRGRGDRGRAGRVARDRHELDRPRAHARDGRGVRREGRRDARRPRQRAASRGAIDATLSIMVGGDDAGVRARDPRSSRRSATSIVHVGPSGAGQVCKACNQLVVAATIEAVAEALLLAERSGVDAAKVREALARRVRGLEDPRGARPAHARPNVRSRVPHPAAPQGRPHRRGGGGRDARRRSPRSRP